MPCSLSQLRVIVAGLGFAILLAGAEPAIRSATPSLAQHGVMLGTVAAYLSKPPVVPAPQPVSDDDAVQYRALMIRQALRSEAETLADCNGARPLAVDPGDSATALMLKQMPCVMFETWAEQLTSEFAESTQTGFTAIERAEGKTIVHRFVRDGLRQIYVSYDAIVETLPDGGYRLSFGASKDQPPADVAGKAGWTVLTPAKYPAPQIMRDEDAIRLELYPNGDAPGGTRRIVDYVHVGRRDRMTIRKDAPHDAYADDAELTITQPRFRVNGVARETLAATPETIRGPVVWMYAPGYGRYVLTLNRRPEAGFEEAGETGGNSLTFAADGNIFRIDAADRMAMGSGTYTVQVLRDSEWQPADPADRGRIMIGADRYR